MNVYLIHARSTNRYKIGITARSIEYRLKELNGEQSAYPLELITSIRHANYKDVERHLHERYAANRVHGEWFLFSAEQLAEVQEYMRKIDTPLNNIKPILKPKPQESLSLQQLKGWLMPLLIAMGLIYTCQNIEFFHPRQQQSSPNETTRAITKPSKRVWLCSI